MSRLAAMHRAAELSEMMTTMQVAAPTMGRAARECPAPSSFDNLVAAAPAGLTQQSPRVHSGSTAVGCEVLAFTHTVGECHRRKVPADCGLLYCTGHIPNLVSVPGCSVRMQWSQG